jgi:hypothetical protein
METPEYHKKSIGDFLVSIGVLTRAQVADILLRQANGDPRILGEIAIDLNYFDERSIKRYVDYVELIEK